MNKRKNNDESVIFPKINPGNRPQFHETSFHVSSSDRQYDQPVATILVPERDTP